MNRKPLGEVRRRRGVGDRIPARDHQVRLRVKVEATLRDRSDTAPRRPASVTDIIPAMWTKMMGGARKKAPKTIAVIDPDRCFGAFACSICQAACPVSGCIVEEPDADGRMVCAVRADLCIGCGLCVTLGNPTAPQQREFGCPPDYDAINMIQFDEVVRLLTQDGEKAAVGV